MVQSSSPGAAGGAPDGRPARIGSATSCWSATPGSGKTTLVEALLAAAGTDHPGRARRGRHHRQRLRRGRAPPAALGLPRPRPARARRRQDQPARHPRVRRLRRRPARRPARRRRRPVRGLGRRRRRRRHPACSGRSAPRSACRAPWSSPSSTRHRADFDEACSRRLPARRSATGCCRSTCRWPPTTARPAGLIGLLSQQVDDYSGGTRGRARPGRRAPAADRGARATR